MTVLEGGVDSRSNIFVVGERWNTAPTELWDLQISVKEGYVGPTFPW